MNYRAKSFKFLPNFFLTLAFLLTGLLTSVKTINSQTNKVGKFILEYQPTSSHQQVRNLLIKTKVFDTIISNLNTSGLIMREDIPVIFKDCGVPNAYWSPSKREITICYENTGYDIFLFREKAGYPLETAVEKSINETIVAFYHELGHGLIDVLPLSAVGQEEDTVDEFAAVMLFRTYKPDVAAEMVLDAAEFYELVYKTNGRGPGWGEHAPNDKRLFNLVCLVYGSNPEKYAEVFVKKFVLVDSEGRATEQAIKRRAARCQQEFPKKMSSWNKLLLPHYATDNPDQPNNRTLHNSPGVSRRGSHW